jgi:hypothetical protein
LIVGRRSAFTPYERSRSAPVYMGWGEWINCLEEDALTSDAEMDPPDAEIDEGYLTPPPSDQKEFKTPPSKACPKKPPPIRKKKKKQRKKQVCKVKNCRHCLEGKCKNKIPRATILGLVCRDDKIGKRARNRLFLERTKPNRDLVSPRTTNMMNDFFLDLEIHRRKKNLNQPCEEEKLIKQATQEYFRHRKRMRDKERKNDFKRKFAF